MDKFIEEIINHLQEEILQEWIKISVSIIGIIIGFIFSYKKIGEYFKNKQHDLNFKKEELRWGREYELYRQILSSFVDFKKKAQDLKNVHNTYKLEQTEDFKIRKRETDNLVYLMRDIIDKNWPFLSKKINKDLYLKIKKFEENSRYYHRNGLWDDKPNSEYYEKITQFHKDAEDIYDEITTIISDEYNK